MPTPQMKAYAEKYNVPLPEIEKFWKEAKAEYGEDYAKISGTVKKMAQNYKKSKGKKNESFIMKSIGILSECGDGDCGCKGKGDCKCGDKCKCKKKGKKKGLAALTGDELAGMTEEKEKKDEKKAKCSCGWSGTEEEMHTDRHGHKFLCPECGKEM